MKKNPGKQVLRKNFDKLLDEHLNTLRFLVSQLYKLFDSIIIISVAVVGIIIPVILSSKYPTNRFILFISFVFFVVVILTGILWRFVELKKAENKFPKILQQESENYAKSIVEIKRLDTNNVCEIVENNFQSNINKNVYRTKIFEIVFITLFCIGIILFAFSVWPTKYENSMFQEIGKARLGINNDEIILYEADTKGHLGKIFLFSKDDGSIATTLSVENLNIEGPSFRIVKGHKRDWLVVTTIENSGTGYMKHIDTWYIANPYYQANLAVLSYPSDGHITEWTDIQNQNLNTSVEAISEDDNVIDVKFILKTCDTKDECIETVKIARYVWNNDKNIFILDDKKSEINALQVSDLLTIR